MITFGLLQNAMGVVFGITIFLSSFLGVTDCWPEGTYGLPMPKNGCPPTQGTFEWKTGSRTHETETGSHGSDPIHLAGIYSTESNKITQSFCMKESYKGEGSWEWEPGKYCFFKKGACPNGFKEGSIFWDDYADSGENQVNGSVPDGNYFYNTEIEFCCRVDGFLRAGINLPPESDIYLFPSTGEGCQKINGMTAREEYVKWFDSQTNNISRKKGLVPRVFQNKKTKTTKLYYCYYEPKHKPTGVKIVGIVIAAIISGLLFICICRCMIKEIIASCCSRNASSGQNEPASPGEDVVFIPERSKGMAHHVQDSPTRPQPSAPEAIDEGQVILPGRNAATTELPPHQDECPHPEPPPSYDVVIQEIVDERINHLRDQH